MGRHSLVRESKLRGPVRGAIIAGAVAGTAALPAIPAMAQTISIPGVGNFDIPEVPKNIQDQLGAPQTQQQIQQMVSQAPPQVQDVVKNVVAQVAQAGVPVPEPFAATAGERALNAARTKVGTPYVWGGAKPGGFDCSGLVKWSYQQAGVHVPRTSFEQAHAGAPVPLNALRPGDVVITNGGSHAALYAGNGQILEAPQAGESVKYAPLSSQRVYTARRL